MKKIGTGGVRPIFVYVDLPLLLVCLLTWSVRVLCLELKREALTGGLNKLTLL